MSISPHCKKEISHMLANYEAPGRIALSRRLPMLKRPIIFARRVLCSTKNKLNPDIRAVRQEEYFPCVVARHQSVLRRRLGDSDPVLQERKVVNLSQAAKKLDTVVIPPGKIFSLWEIIGRPTEKRGYVNGMLLANGKIVEGPGGGLCQLSNFLFWILLHAPVEVVERYHHSMDVFPDSGRVLPFGSGATILYNFVDLKVRNVSDQPLQLKIWLNDKYLKGQILSPKPLPSKFHIYEKNHCFVKRGARYFRYNEIWREEKVAGKVVRTARASTNFAPVLYEVPAGYFQQHDFTVLDYS